MTRTRVRDPKPFLAAIQNKSGIEIGGPSGVFQDTGILPLYSKVNSLDNCVFSTSTTWEGTRAEGRTYQFHTAKPPGFNFIREATDLQGIETASYDFVLSSHNLEHVANPVKALIEWKRVLRPGGALILILPHYKHTFDHRRPPTTLAHLWNDYSTPVDEHDTTHLQEVLELHDLSRDPGCQSREHLNQRALDNFENRCMHHHVFDERNSRELLESVGFGVPFQEFVRPYHLVFLATPKHVKISEPVGLTTYIPST